MEITLYGFYQGYPHGRAYDNLFNAEHRALMVETYGFTSASSITVEDLLNAK